ncbi:hypothetical protein HK414_06475 [Ramlibacter terrae]|uniref:IclR-ED domain-containing protein n=1 Tax=Ramlibacter terrae TaxID=2732511 RepID=A0ABX6P2Y1_9BURK|nr:hypothetical protein HK414_06475 [Ramlibacter terrae]
MNPGIHALSAPILDHMGTIVGAVSLLGPPDTFDSSLTGPNATLLAQRASDVSRRPGWAP